MNNKASELAMILALMTTFGMGRSFGDGDEFYFILYGVSVVMWLLVALIYKKCTK